MDYRDSATLLCLLMPWLFAAALPAFRHYTVPLMTTYVACNALLLAGPVITQGIPSVIQLNPLQVHSFADRGQERRDLLRHGVPGWLLSDIRQSRTIEMHHPDVMAMLDDFDDVVMLSNLQPAFHTSTLPASQPPAYVEPSSALERWVRGGECLTYNITIMMIIFEWDYLRGAYSQNLSQVAEHCPEAPRTRLEHATVYRLDQTIPEYAQGLAYAEQGEWQRAIDIYDAALAFNPDNVRAYADRGAAYMALQQWEQAIADSGQAIDRMPGWAQPYRLRGEAYAATGNTEQAQADFDKAAALEQAIQESEVGQSDDPPD
jgi:hypothetical protein